MSTNANAACFEAFEAFEAYRLSRSQSRPRPTLSLMPLPSPLPAPQTAGLRKPVALLAMIALVALAGRLVLVPSKTMALARSNLSRAANRAPRAVAALATLPAARPESAAQAVAQTSEMEQDQPEDAFASAQPGRKVTSDLDDADAQEDTTVGKPLSASTPVVLAESADEFARNVSADNARLARSQTGAGEHVQEGALLGEPAQQVAHLPEAGDARIGD